VHWAKILRYQQTSEKFLIEFKDKIGWYMVTEGSIPEPV
jgi:hypothetical protein